MLTPKPLHLTNAQIDEAAWHAAWRDHTRPIDRRHVRPRETRKRAITERKERPAS